MQKDFTKLSASAQRRQPLRRKLRALSLALSLAAGTLAAPAHAADTLPEGPTTNDRINTARDSIKAGDYKRALAELQLAVKDEPRNADVHNLLGYSYRKQPSANLSKAFEHYGTALRLDPRHKGAHEYIGEAYLMSKKPAEAEKHLVELEKICGNRTCEEYKDLAASLAAYKVANK